MAAAAAELVPGAAAMASAALLGAAGSAGERGSGAPGARLARAALLSVSLLFGVARAQPLPAVPAGWSVAMKTAGDDVWRYDSPLWADGSVLDAESDPLAPGNAKYPAYNSQCFDAIQLCVGHGTGEGVDCTAPHVFSEVVENAGALFGGGYRREGVGLATGFPALFRASGHKDCPPQLPGFNTVCRDGNAARWGYCNNVPEQACQDGAGDDADGAIGLGLVGQDCCPIGAGHTNFFVSNDNSAGNELRTQAWVLVRDCVRAAVAGSLWEARQAQAALGSQRSPPGEAAGDGAELWVVVLKTDGDATFGYSSSYWSDDALLNEHSEPLAPGNAKYAEYNTLAFDAIRACVGTADRCAPPHTFAR